MGEYSLIEHTADVGVTASGKSFADALAWLAAGMFSLLVDLDTVQPMETLVLRVESHDAESLAVDWLNELLFQHEAYGFLLKDCTVTLDDNANSLSAVCRGQSIEPSEHELYTVIKAATYHGVTVTHDLDWRIDVILDI